MTPGAWLCVRVAAGCAAVVPVSAGVMALWISRNPVPACEASRVVCRWVIPPEEFRPGGSLYRMPEPGGLVPLAEPHLQRSWAPRGVGHHDRPTATVIDYHLPRYVPDYHPPKHVPDRHPPQHVPIPDHPVPVSEPGALALMLSGLGLLAAVRRWRRNSPTGKQQ